MNEGRQPEETYGVLTYPTVLSKSVLTGQLSFMTAVNRGSTGRCYGTLVKMENNHSLTYSRLSSRVHIPTRVILTLFLNEMEVVVACSTIPLSFPPPPLSLPLPTTLHDRENLTANRHDMTP